MSTQATAFRNLTVRIDEKAANLSTELLDAAGVLADRGSRVELRLTAAQFAELPAHVSNRVSIVTR